MDRNRQQNTVSVGFALGLAAMDRNELPGDKVSFDLAFMKHWRHWRYARYFPAVTGPSPVDAWWVAQGYTERKRTPYSLVFWDEGHVWTRRDLDDADPAWVEQADDLISEIPGRAWLELVQNIVEDVEA